MNIDMIRAAATRLRGHARETPLLSSPALDKVAGRRVFVKAESLQHTGSFKYRGAKSAVTALPDGTQGVIAFSSGNHAQGIARASMEAGLPAVIIMPRDAPAAKIDATRSMGAEVVLYDRGGREAREELGARLAAERGLTLIRPYDEPQVIAGQGTTGLEIARQAAAEGIERGEVLVCCGGGGLTSGVALALEAEAPGFRVRPAEPEGYDDVARSLISGQRERNAKEAGGLCDAILTPMPGELTYPILKRLCGPGVVVSEAEAQAAMVAAFQHLNLVLEPGGAVGLAAALFRGDEIEGEAVVAVASGGNVDAGVFTRALEVAA